MSAAVFQAAGSRRPHRGVQGQHGGRPQRGRPGMRPAGHAGDPARLDEIPFGELVCRIVFGRTKGPDAAVWGRLLEADLVVRTETALQRAQERNAAAIARRRADWLGYVEERVGRKVDAAEWQSAQQDFHDWCARAESFAGVIAKALPEVTRARRKQVRDISSGEVGLLRDALARVAGAVREHRAALDDGDVIAEGHDLALWSVLDTVTVPDGRGGGELTLAALFDEHSGGVK